MSIVSVTITEVLKKTEQQFSEAGIPSPRLDAEVLLAYTLGVERNWLHAHGDEKVQLENSRAYGQLVERRLDREPVAYITGTKEFYGREFIVTPDVLIPRPETEDLVELGIETAYNIPHTSHHPYGLYALDVGTGSGAVGLTVLAESPRINDMYLLDISPKALAVAKQNNRKLFHLKRVQYYESDLLLSLSGSSVLPVDLILANLPYVDKSWETSPETAHEPALALYADHEGLALIFQLIEQSQTALRQFGYLLLEADPEQHDSIIEFAFIHGFVHKETRGYALSFMKQQQA